MLRKCGFFLVLPLSLVACSETLERMERAPAEPAPAPSSSDGSLDGLAASDGGLRHPLDAALRHLLDAALADTQVPSRARDGEATRVHGDAQVEPAPAWSLCDQLAERVGMTLAAPSRVSMARLLCETADLDRFTQAPRHAYRAKLASSYDRGAQREGESGWFGNADYSMYLRDEGDEHVMMESFGPGAITRLWTPTPSGLIRIYIDDPLVPAIEVAISELMSGNFQAPWGEPFVFAAAEGYSAYFPVPYARYARVSTTTDERFYYQVNYREYASETDVEPYSQAALSELAPLAAELARTLSDPAHALALLDLQERSVRLDAAAPEATLELGPAVIRELSVHGFPSDEATLRNVRLVLTVDGERTVDAPLGDLFGAGPGVREHASVATTMASDVLSLRWPMPVKGVLRVRAEVNGGAVMPLDLRFRYSTGVPADYRLFHARWTGARQFDTSSPFDWTVLHFEGTGSYVGTVLNVSNPTGWWWGEGDERIFVDGEQFPSHFGTGTEDYFGFGWCSNELFARPWMGQTRADGPRNQGRSSQYRWHLGDAVPFDSELRLTFEVLHWISGALSVSMSQSAVAYWYAEPGGVNRARPLDLPAFQVPPFVGYELWLPESAYNCRL